MAGTTSHDDDLIPPEPTVASILGIKGPLRFRSHGSTQKAHVVLRQVDLSDDSDDEGEPKQALYFSLFAQKRIEVKPGKEILLAVATPDGRFIESPVIFTGDLVDKTPPPKEEPVKEVPVQVVKTPEPPAPTYTLPPKMRKSWARPQEHPAPVPPTTRTTTYSSVGVQSDHTYASHSCQTSSHNSPVHMSSSVQTEVETQTLESNKDIQTGWSPSSFADDIVQAISAMSAGTNLIIPEASSAIGGEATEESCSSKKALEGHQATPPVVERERSLSPMELDSPPGTPHLSPANPIVPSSPSVSSSKSQSMSLSLPELDVVTTAPSSVDETAKISPLELSPDHGDAPGLDFGTPTSEQLASFPAVVPKKLSTTSSPPGSPDYSPSLSLAALGAEAERPISAADNSESPSTSSVPYYPKRKAVPNPFVSGGFVTDFVSTNQQTVKVLPQKIEGPRSTTEYGVGQLTTPSPLSTITTLRSPTASSSSRPQSPMVNLSAPASSSKVKVEDVFREASQPAMPRLPMSNVVRNGFVSLTEPAVFRTNTQSASKEPANLRDVLGSGSVNTSRSASQVSAGLNDIAQRKPSPPPDPKRLVHIPNVSFSNPLGIRPSNVHILSNTPPPVNLSISTPTPPSQSKKRVIVGNGWPHVKKASLVNGIPNGAKSALQGTPSTTSSIDVHASPSQNPVQFSPTSSSVDHSANKWQRIDEVGCHTGATPRSSGSLLSQSPNPEPLSSHLNKPSVSNTTTKPARRYYPDPIRPIAFPLRPSDGKPPPPADSPPPPPPSSSNTTTKPARRYYPDPIRPIAFPLRPSDDKAPPPADNPPPPPPSLSSTTTKPVRRYYPDPIRPIAFPSRLSTNKPPPPPDSPPPPPPAMASSSYPPYDYSPLSAPPTQPTFKTPQAYQPPASILPSLYLSESPTSPGPAQKYLSASAYPTPPTYATPPPMNSLPPPPLPSTSNLYQPPLRVKSPPALSSAERLSSNATPQPVSKPAALILPPSNRNNDPSVLQSGPSLTILPSSHPLPPKPVGSFNGAPVALPWSPRRGVKRMVSPISDRERERERDRDRERDKEVKEPKEANEGSITRDVISVKRPTSWFKWPMVESVHSIRIRGEGDVGIRTIAFSNDGNHFAVICYDKSVRIWSHKTRCEVAKLAHTMPVLAAAWLDHDAGVITLGDNGLVSTWTRNVHNKWQWAKILDAADKRNSDETPGYFAFCKDRIAIAFPRIGVKVWLFIKGTWLPQRSILRQNVTSIRFIEDGDALLGATGDGVLWHCDVPNGTLRALTFLKSKVLSLDVETPRGAHALATLNNSRVQLVKVLQDDHKATVEQTYLTQDNDKLGFVSYDFGAVFANKNEDVLFGAVRGCIIVWDRNSGEIVSGLAHPEDDSSIEAVVSYESGSDGNAGSQILTGTRKGRLTWFTQPPSDVYTQRKRVKVN
ncbi:hypothetical protein C8Q75DRAFT_579545 [Abortiporus biennis]|nr:hypothetical protein C8Q75DRAFT_579545 [Abortiporus biennis]